MADFQDIKGNQQAKGLLAQSLAAGKHSHAYLFVGGSGMGKKLLAHVFAKALQCQAEGNRPCGVCKSCIVFESKNHPDVFLVTPTKGKTIGVEDVREQVIGPMEIKQYAYRYKIFIIDKADEMTIPAQNALLKTLEEPASYGIFLLLAKNQNTLLPTVLSRCMPVRLLPVGNEEIREYLIAEGLATGEDAALLAEYAQGSIGQAKKMATSETFLAMKQDVLETVSRLQEKSLFDTLVLAKAWEKYKEEEGFFDLLYLWYRDVFVAKSVQDDNFLLQKEQKNAILAQCDRESYDSLSEKLFAIEKAKKRKQANANFQLVLEVLLMELKGEFTDDRDSRCSF